jgi:hypothetical protein
MTSVEDARPDGLVLQADIFEPLSECVAAHGRKAPDFGRDKQPYLLPVIPPKKG